MKKIIIYLVVVYLFVLLIHSKCLAQQVSLSLSPTLLEVFIKPGKEILIAYKIENLSDPVVLSSRLSSFIPTDEKGNIKILDRLDGPIRFSFENSDIQIDQPFFLKNKAEQQVLLKIRVPEGAPEGDYYYSILFETKPSTNLTGNTSAGAKATIGSNILITVSREGASQIDGDIVEFVTIPHWKFNLFGKSYNIFESDDKIPVILNIKNNGKNLIKPEGEIVLKNSENKKTKFAIISQNILAESQRVIKASPSAQLHCPQDGSVCDIKPSLIISGFHFGKFSLEANINFGENTKSISAGTDFISIPFKIIGILLLCIVFTCFLIYKYSRDVEPNI